MLACESVCSNHRTKKYSQTNACMRVSVFKSQDLGRRAGGGGGLAPRPPARAIQARLCQSDSEVKKKFPQSKKAAKHESVVVGLIF